MENTYNFSFSGEAFIEIMNFNNKLGGVLVCHLEHFYDEYNYLSICLYGLRKYKLKVSSRNIFFLVKTLFFLFLPHIIYMLNKFIL